MKDFKVYQASGYLTKLVTDASDVRKTYEEISGSLVEFDTPISAPLAELIVDINPVQDLHGQNAPYPPGGGSNLIDPSACVTGRLDNVGGITNANIWAVTDWIPCLPNTDYCGRAVIPAANGYAFCFYDENKTFLRYATISGTSGYSTVGVRNSGNDAAYMRLTVQKNNLERVAYCSPSSSIIPFAPYSNICPITGWTGANIYHSGEDTSDPTTYTISWQDDAGTVYGGTVDLVSGVMTVDTVKAVADGTQSPSNYDDHFIQFISKFPTAAGYNPTDINLKCNYLRPSGYTESNNNVIFFSNAIIIFFRVSESVSNWTTYLQDNPVEFSYKIAEPITYQLTPQEIITLVGVNNIWADTGDVSVKYRTH